MKESIPKHLRKASRGTWRHSSATPTHQQSPARHGYWGSLRRGQGRAVESQSVSSSSRTNTSTDFSLLEENLWTETKRLRAVTSRLRQRVCETKIDLAGHGCTVDVMGNSSSLRPESDVSSATFISGSQLQQLKKTKKHQNKNNTGSAFFFLDGSCKKADNGGSQFASPIKTSLKDADESVLTSLMSFQYTPRVGAHNRGHSKDAEKQVGKEEKFFFDMQTQTNKNARESFSTAAAAVAADDPVVVELLTTEQASAASPVRVPTSMPSTHTTAKHILLQAQLLSVEQELNRYMTDLFALQQDVLDAQKRRMTDANDPSFCELRLSLRDELNVCNTRIATIERLRVALDFKEDTGVDAS